MEDDTSLKARKEAFVTGHEGSDHPWEVLWICSAVIWGCWLYTEVVGRYRINPETKGCFALEALLIWIPIVIAQTKFLYPYGSCIMLCQIILAASLSLSKVKNGSNPSTSAESKSTEPTTTKETQRLNYLTLYRSSIYYLTFVAILAVDFHVFPRRFCKTEVSGYGLMDMGAASFCISGGIAKGKAYTKKTTQTKSGWWSWFQPLAKAAPLVMIGVVRCVTNKQVEYQEHVTEYGVHWNFFVTLGVLAILPTIRRQLLMLPSTSYKVVPLAKICQYCFNFCPLVAILVYQRSLLEDGLQDYIVNEPRTGGFFAANREGILGCFGYMFLHTAGEWVGQYFVFNERKRSLGILVLALWVTHFLPFTYHSTLTVSRRSTNLPFCLWALAHNITLLWGLRLLEQWRKDQQPVLVPPTWNAVNRHGMVSFLVANILTGLVNITMPTLDIGDIRAIEIILGYVSVLGALVRTVDSINWSKLVHNGTTTISSEIKKKN